MTDHRPIGVALENRLMSHGIYVINVRRLSSGIGQAEDHDVDEVGGRNETASDDLPDGIGLDLEYETVAESSGVDSNEVGAVVRTLLDIGNEREWTPGRLEATSLTTDGQLRGRWHVERAWFDGLGMEYDDLEFSQRVLETVETSSGSR